VLRVPIFFSEKKEKKKIRDNPQKSACSALLFFSEKKENVTILYIVVIQKYKKN